MYTANPRYIEDYRVYVQPVGLFLGISMASTKSFVLVQISRRRNNLLPVCYVNIFAMHAAAELPPYVGFHPSHA
jgi:hypothetical protein